MMTEKNYNRDILKAFIAKEIFRCKNNEYYTFGILVSDSEKIKLVKLLIEEVIGNKEYAIRYKSSDSEFYIELENGSIIKVLVAFDNVRGNRYHALVLDSNINEETKQCVGYCKFINYPCQFVTDENGKLQHKPIINDRTDLIEINIE